GRLITHKAIECHAPVPAGLLWPRNGSRSRSTHGPRTESTAGRNVSPYRTAIETTIVPAAPIDARNVPWKKSIADSPLATVTPEGVMARPAGDTDVARGSSTAAPDARP